MPITFTNILASGSGTDGTTHATASFTPVAGRLYLVSMTERNGSSTNPGVPSASFSGIGLSALTVPTNGSVVYDNSSGSRRRLTVFYALASGSPTSGTITFTHSASMTSADWSIEAVTGIDLTTPVLQAANDFTPLAVAGVTRTATLAAFASADNVAFGAGASGQALAPMSPGSGFTALSSAVNDGETGQWLITEYKLSNDNTVDVSGDNEIGVVGLEIKAAGAATQTISATGIASSPSVGAPSVSAGAVAIAASAIASSLLIGAPALSPGAVSITASGVSNVSSVGAPSFSSAYTLASAGLSSTATIGTPALSPGTVSISPSGLPSVSSVGSPTITSSATVAPVGLASTLVIGSPIVAAAGTGVIMGSGVDSTAALGSPTLTPGGVSASASGITSTTAIGTPTLSAGGANVGATGLASATTVGSPTLTPGTVSPIPAGVESSTVFGSPALSVGGTGQPAIPEVFLVDLAEPTTAVDLLPTSTAVDLPPTTALSIALDTSSSTVDLEAKTLSADLKADTITIDL